MKHKKLNIVFLDFDDIKNPLLGAGQARATLEVGSRLARLGHNIKIISAKYPGYKDRKENGIEYKHIGIDTGNIRFNNIIYILRIPFAVRQIKNADIIVECFTAPVSTMFSPLFTKIPVVALPTSFEAERFAKLYHFPFDKIEQYGLRTYKYYLPYTESFDRRMKKENKNIISKIVPEGVGEEFFKIRPKKKKHILFLGRLDMGQKGIDLLLSAYSIVREAVNYPLIIAGNGPDEEKIKKMVKKLELEEKVTMVGPAFGEAKTKLLSEAICVAFTSRHEGFSLFSLEALASALPLLGFDIPGLSWTTEDAVLKAKRFDVKAYAKLLLLANDSSLMKKMSSAARNLAKKYTWDNVSSKFESFFYEILEREKNEN